jgi:hypothetical protein
MRLMFIFLDGEHVKVTTVPRYQKTKKDKRTNNDQQNNTQKTNEGATRTPLKIWNALVGLAGPATD